MFKILSYIAIFILAARIFQKYFSSPAPVKQPEEEIKIKNTVEEKPLTQGQGEYIDYEEIKE